MGNVKLRSVFGIFLIVAAASLTVLAGCASGVRPVGVDGSRNAGGVRPGDTNVTNLVAGGDVTVGGDLTVAGECVGCGGVGYNTYVALLSQAGTDPPVATVLANTLGGTVVWTYYDVGQYIGTLIGAFPVARTVILYPQGGFGSVWTTVDMGISADGNSIVVYAPLDGALNDSMSGNGRPVEVRVYP